MAELTRRTLVGAGATALVVTGVGGGAEAAPLRRGSGPLKRGDYAAAVGTVFVARRDGRSHRFRLTHVADAGGRGRRQDRFLLVFEPVRGARPDDGIFLLTHRKLRDHHLFVSALGPDALQAVVNRVV